MIKEKNENIFLKIIGTTIGRIVVSIIVPFIAFIILYIGFQFLKTSNAPKPILAIIANIASVNKNKTQTLKNHLLKKGIIFF